MKLVNVICARFDEDRNVMHLVKEVESEAGTHLNLHVFAPETLAARAAEYGIDNVDELIDMIIHEAHIEAVAYLNMSAEDATSLHRERREAVKAAMPKAKTTKADKEAKLRAAKVPEEYIVALEEDPLEVIKRHCTPKPEHVHHFKKQVELARAQRRTPNERRVSKMDARLKVLADQEQIRQMKRPAKPIAAKHVKIVLNKNKVKNI